MKGRSVKIFGMCGLAVALGVGAYAFVKVFQPFGLQPWQIKNAFVDLTRDMFVNPVIYLFETMILTVWFWVALAFTLAMERILPAKPNQKLLSVSFAQDLVWFLYETILHGTVIATYVALLKWIHETYFAGVTIGVIATQPDWARFVFALLLSDSMHWLQHLINHKVPWLWEFHKVHHSQKNLNFFTDFRYHVLEYLVRETFLVIPFLVFAVKPPVIVAFAIVKTWYTRFYHANIRTSLGLLRYALVTPQSHRVHHSMERRHYDRNFGSLFCIWDLVFGTQYTGFHEYPDTGVFDPDFPHERAANLGDLVLTPFRQMAYPFKSIKAKWFAKPAAGFPSRLLRIVSAPSSVMARCQRACPTASGASSTAPSKRTREALFSARARECSERR